METTAATNNVVLFEQYGIVNYIVKYEYKSIDYFKNYITFIMTSLPKKKELPFISISEYGLLPYPNLFSMSLD